MATINKEIADIIIKNDGYYPGDPRVNCVIKYTNRWGGESYAIAYSEGERKRYFDADSGAIDPKVIWSAK